MLTVSPIVRCDGMIIKLLATDLEQLLQDRVNHLRNLLAEVIVSADADSIHHARVTSRRLKAVIDLLKTTVSDELGRPFARSLRKLRKKFGPLRDVDVMLVHLSELRGKTSAAIAVDWISTQLIQRREELWRDAKRPKWRRRVSAGLAEWETIRAAFASQDIDWKSLVTESAGAQLKAFSDSADLVLEQRGLKPDAAASTSNVHDVRIAGKHLRYTLELMEPLGIAVPKTVMKSFKKLQEALGVWHDFVVLGENVLQESLDELIAVNDANLYGAILELARECWKQGERSLNRFVDAWTEYRTELTETIDRALTSPAAIDEKPSDESNVSPAAITGDEKTAVEPPAPDETNES